MFCGKCGREVSGNAKFCNYCGNRFESDTSSQGAGSRPKEQIEPMKLKDDKLSSKTLKLPNSKLAKLQTKYEDGALSYEEMIEDPDLLSNFDDVDFKALARAAKENVKNQHKVEDLTAAADECLQNKLYTAAVDYYNGALAIDPMAEAALAGLEQASNEYRSYLLNRAAEYAKQDNYLPALGVLEGGLSYLKNDSVLLNEIDALNKRYEAFVYDNSSISFKGPFYNAINEGMSIVSYSSNRFVANSGISTCVDFCVLFVPPDLYKQ